MASPSRRPRAAAPARAAALTEAARSRRAATSPTSSTPEGAGAESELEARAATAGAAEARGGIGTAAKASRAAHPTSPPQLPLAVTRASEEGAAALTPPSSSCEALKQGEGVADAVKSGGVN